MTDHSGEAPLAQGGFVVDLLGKGFTEEDFVAIAALAEDAGCGRAGPVHIGDAGGEVGFVYHRIFAESISIRRSRDRVEMT